MAAILTLGQALKGKVGTYIVIKQLEDRIWLARDQHQQIVVVKSIRHFRLQNERDVLLRFQNRTPFIRPLIDEVVCPSAPALILRHLDDDLLHASNTRRLNRLEVKYVAKRVLESLSVLHDEGFVHTDIKPSNVLVTYGNGGQVRFKDVQLADFGSTVHAACPYAQGGILIGTSIFRSPEAILELKWDTATDIWSFAYQSYLWRGFSHLCPGVPPEHVEYDLKNLMKHHRCFGPFPVPYEKIANDEELAILTWITENSPVETLEPFRFTTTREMCQEDKEFVLKIMKLDPRGRPTARQLLEDEWFHQV